MVVESQPPLPILEGVDRVDRSDSQVDKSLIMEPFQQKEELLQLLHRITTAGKAVEVGSHSTTVST